MVEAELKTYSYISSPFKKERQCAVYNLQGFIVHPSFLKYGSSVARDGIETASELDLCLCFLSGESAMRLPGLPTVKLTRRCNTDRPLNHTDIRNLSTDLSLTASLIHTHIIISKISFPLATCLSKNKKPSLYYIAQKEHYSKSTVLHSTIKTTTLNSIPHIPFNWCEKEISLILFIFFISSSAFVQ